MVGRIKRECSKIQPFFVITFLLILIWLHRVLVVTHGLSSLTRDQTHIPCIGRQILTIGPPGKSVVITLKGV